MQCLFSPDLTIDGRKMNYGASILSNEYLDNCIGYLFGMMRSLKWH